MTDQATETARPENWREWSPKELASSWLDVQTKLLDGKVKSAETSLRFYETYQPKPASRPSNVEPGSMDASDWDIAEAEFDNWPEEQNEMIELYEGERDDLNRQLEDLGDEKGGVKDGNQELIEKYSQLEKARREKEEELQKARLAKPQ